MVPTHGQAQPASTATQAPATVTMTVENTVAAPTVTTTVLRREPTSAPGPETSPKDPPAPPISGGSGISDAEIRSQTGTAFTVVDTYWSNVFAGWEDDAGQPVQWWTPDRMGSDGFDDSANGDPMDCSGTPGPLNAAFCSNGRGSGAVSWDLELFRQEEQLGDAPIYAIVAHEVAHAAQARFWFDGEGGATPNPNDSVAYEQQADCLSGATLSKAAQDGYLTIEPGDLDGIAAFYWGLEKDGDHGTPADRLAAFELGFGTGDVESCLYNRGVPPPGL